MIRIKLLLISIFSLFILLLSPIGISQNINSPNDYPLRPVKIVIPYVAGGGIDIVGRTISQKISTAFNQNYFIEHISGAGGLIGSNYVAKSSPDGYTLLMTSSAHTTLPSFSKEKSYDPVKDFIPLSLIAWSAGHVLVINPGLPFNSVQELILYAKANPGKLRYGSGGKGSFTQFAAENFNLMANIKVEHIPYKGGGQAIIDCIAGHIEICFIPATAALSHVKSKQLKPLGITAVSRWSEMPTTPTINEAGVNGFNYVTWYGLFLPAKTPNHIVQKLLSEIQKIVNDSEIKKIFKEQGLISAGTNVDEFQSIIAKEFELNKKLSNLINALP
jgi:tripartite-type tricarboxylate transporter receptor subunit TctC